MPLRDPATERALADAIRKGADRRPEQAFGDYFRGRSASCALGAAYEGMYRLPGDMEGRRPTKDLEQYFDCLEGTVRKCPVAGCRKVISLGALIVHLNDSHLWTREAIAAWVADDPPAAAAAP
jgi:hypothetical protein